MLFKRLIRRAAWTLAISIAVLVAVAMASRLLLQPPPSPDVALEEADRMAWVNNWIEAEPLYRRAELQFARQHEAAKALYARVSQMPAHMEARSLPDQLWILTQDLALPEAKEPQTRLRILLVKGMIETNYDGATARTTWQTIQALAQDQHQFLLAARASGEQGIAAFLLGNIKTARSKVMNAYLVAKYAKDYAAQLRYASVYGAGLVELRKYKESLGPLDEAIEIWRQHPGIAYPNVAVSAKIEALSGLDRNQEALALTEEALRYPRQHGLSGHLYQLLSTRAGVYKRMNRWHNAITDYAAALSEARRIFYWRGISEVGGPLAKAYEHDGDLKQALSTIDEAIEANTRIPDELYFAPRNLAIKAEITARLGQTVASNQLYEKSADLIDSLLATAPTANVERSLLEQLSEVYSGYFSALCNQGQYAKALQVIEKARGRIEAQSLQHHGTVTPHDPTTAERKLTALNVRLLNTADPDISNQLSKTIYDAEQQLEPTSLEGQTATNPVDLDVLQQHLRPSELFIEYVLAGDRSYALAVTKNSVKDYELPAKRVLEDQAEKYRCAIRKRKEDLGTGEKLFTDLLAPIKEYADKPTLIIVPDGKLHLLPFSALVTNGKYVVATHEIATVPSGTVLTLLRNRTHETNVAHFPYVGVAAWIKTFDARNLLLLAISGSERRALLPLPESKREVEAIATDLPKPSTLLLGDQATETHFKQLPLGEYNVLHLALHGYADLDYPDRSALVFAPQKLQADDGLLQIREIRQLHLNANLVTLSACNTGVGPVGEEGVDNLVNAFIQAGAQSVVSTLWETEDHATTHLMTDFYSRLAHQNSKGSSLREAELQLISAGLPPYYWAGFELVGDSTGSISETSPALSASEPQIRSSSRTNQ
jgi:CHAT domain-containing protein